jgi:hypothetical protein
MREIPLLFIALLISVLVSGCSQTPAKVENEVPGVLANVSNDAGNAAGAFERNVTHDIVGTTNIPVTITLSPINSNYVAPPVSAIAIVTAASPDKIVGEWALMGDNKPADCDVTVRADNTGEMRCDKFGVPVEDQTFAWTALGSNYSNVDEYAIITDGGNYTAEYSERNGWITSEDFPAGTELERRS